MTDMTCFHDTKKGYKAASVGKSFTIVDEGVVKQPWNWKSSAAIVKDKSQQELSWTVSKLVNTQVQ